MKRFSILVAFALLAYLPTQAQQPAQTQNEVRVLYSRNIPTIVRQEIPSGGETKFFGVWKLKTSKRELLIHFYSAPTKKTPCYAKLIFLSVIAWVKEVV